MPSRTFLGKHWASQLTAGCNTNLSVCCRWEQVEPAVHVLASSTSHCERVVTSGSTSVSAHYICTLPGEVFISFIKCFHHPAFIRWVNIPRLGDQTRHTLKLMNQGELFHAGSFQWRQRGWSGVFWMFLLSGRRRQRKVITQVHGGYQTGWWWNVYWEVCP